MYYLLQLSSTDAVLIEGEHVTEEELVDHLITLLTYANADDQEEADKGLVQQLPQDIDVGYFAEELLGLST